MNFLINEYNFKQSKSYVMQTKRIVTDQEKSYLILGIYKYCNDKFQKSLEYLWNL